MADKLTPEEAMRMLTRRYKAESEALIAVLCPLLIPMHALDKTIHTVPGQNHSRASFTVKLNDETSGVQLGKLFPMTCEGTLVYHKGIYSLEQDIDHPSTDPDHDLICGLADLAEESDTGYALKYSLKEKAIIQILKSCSLSKLCRVVGYVNGLSHDVYFWVRIDSVSAK